MITDSYSYINDAPLKRFAKCVVLGLIASVVCGAFYLWDEGWSIRALLAAILAGVVAASILTVVAALSPKSRAPMLAAVPFAGALGGVAWCVIETPSMAMMWCALTGGALLALLFVLAEFGFKV